MRRHMTGLDVYGEYVSQAVDTSDDEGLTREEGIAVLPALDELFVGFFEDDGVQRASGGGAEERVGGEDRTDLDEFSEGERVQRVLRDVLVVVVAVEVGGFWSGFDGGGGRAAG